MINLASDVYLSIDWFTYRNVIALLPKIVVLTLHIHIRIQMPPLEGHYCKGFQLPGRTKPCGKDNYYLHKTTIAFRILDRSSKSRIIAQGNGYKHSLHVRKTTL
jgi:hypothetical protein